MKDDPYAKLGGLDSRLFEEDAKERTKQRSHERARPRVRESAKEDTNAHSNEAPPEPTKAPAKERSRPRMLKVTSEPTRTPVSQRMGHRGGGRIPERHSHDLFLDQIRWINRLKLDIEETHGERITGNQLVQLAVDVIRDDYARRGDGSLLVRTLVKGEHLPDVDVIVAAGEEAA